MKTLFLIYDPRNWHEPHSLPCNFALVSDNKRHTLDYLLEYPDSHIVLKIWQDAAGTKTITTIAGLREELKALGAI